MKNTMDKSSYINGIIQLIRGLSGFNYQKALGDIFSIYYQGIKTFEMPSPLGGDDKNDGWVVEDAVFYQVFAPVQLNSSFTKDLQEKFADDLDKLLDLVYNQNKWNGVVNKFIFIANTRDCLLPKDPDRFFEKTTENLNKKYNTNITSIVANENYIFDCLCELDLIKLEKIATKLNIEGLINLNKTSPLEIIKFIDCVSVVLGEDNISKKGTSYTRISSDKKIIINKLEEKKERIDNIISKLAVVEKAVAHFTLSISKADAFENVKNKYIELYEELSKDYEGGELYDAILDSIIDFSPDLRAFKLPAEMTLVYIFDMCDIFEKEDNNSDSAQQICFNK